MNKHIQPLPKQTSLQVRAGSAIGSLSRAVEELTRNAILHGHARRVLISYGSSHTSSKLCVRDNGIGIDSEALKMFVGTHHCTSVISGGDEGSIATTSSSNSSPYFSRNSKSKRAKVEKNHRSINMSNKSSRGETLLSLVSLAQEVQIVSANAFKSFRNSGNDASPPLVQFKKLSDSKSIVGTCIIVHGLFHRHAVRRKLHKTKNSHGVVERTEIFQIRACLRLLALAYPYVEITLENARTKTMLEQWRCSRQPTKSTSVSSDLDEECRAIATRLQQLCGETLEFGSFVLPIHHSERDDDVRSNPSILHHPARPSNRRSCWKLYGILSRPTPSCLNKSKQFQFVFINGRLAGNNSALASMIDREYSSRLSFGCDSGMLYPYITIHVSCLDDDVDLVVNESQSVNCVRDLSRLQNFILSSFRKFVSPFEFIQQSPSPFGVTERNKLSSTRAFPTKQGASIGRSKLVSGDNITKESIFDNLSNGDTSLSPCGEPKSKSRVEVTNDELSPFSSAFFDTGASPDFSIQTNKVVPAGDALKDLNTHASSNGQGGSSFEKERNEKTAYDDSPTNDLQWTRTRIRAIETQISNISRSQASISGPLSITKEMLRNAHVISQLDKKFILVYADGILCVVDQHAADERICLERRMNELTDCITKGLDARKSLYSSQMVIKSTSLYESIRLSSALFATVVQHNELLRRWKFTTTMPSSDQLKRNELLIHLTSVPSIYGKVATSKDFLQFLQAIGNRTSDVSQVKPFFANRVLASQACRYAIMFGDELDRAKCYAMIRSLGNCDLSFVCAHGRPSIVPLCNLSDFEDEKKDARKLKISQGRTSRS